MTLEDGKKDDLSKDIKSNGNGINEKDVKTSGNGVTEKWDNVLDLQKDEKLKLQLEIRKMASDLRKEVVDAKKTAAISKLDSHFRDLLGKGTIQRSELNSIKEDIINQYTTAKISNPSGTDTAEDNTKEVKVVEDNTNVVIEKTNKHGIKETKFDAKGAIETIEKEIDASMLTIDQKAEEKYLVWKPSVQMTKPQQDIAFTNFASDVADEVNVQLLTVEERLSMGYRFELLKLKDAVVQSTSSETLYVTSKTGNESIDSETTENTNGRVDIHDLRTPYLDRWENTNFNTDLTRNLKPSENVYKNNHMNQAMKKLLANEKNEIEKLNNGTFGVNLSKEDGFAGIIGLLSKNGLSETTPCVIGKYNFIIENKKIKVSDGTEAPRELTWKDLDAMKKSGLINYEHEKGAFQWDNELSKMTKIMNAANWTDLQDFADISGSRDAQYSAIKETVNAKESILLDKTSVFKFLCDRNGDGVLSANGRRTKEQKNLGDIGNIFGQQLNFTIEQAIKVQDVLHPGQGEQIVIQNIMRTIMIQNPRADKELALYNTAENCTKENLVVSITSNPKFKTYFTAAIEKINGSSSVLTPDLYDTLTGNTINTILKSQDWEMRTTIEGKIDRALKANKDLSKYLETHNIIQLRENLLSQIMNIADGFTLVGSDTKEGYLRNPGISKEFVDQEAKNKFINDLTQQTVNAIAVGVFNPENGIRIPVSFVKNRRSQDGRTLGSVNAGIGAGYNWMDKGILLTAGLGAEVAEQYNYNRVINAKLDDVKTAQYLGAEAQISAGVNLANPTAIIEGSAGIEWQQNRITGINQINRQYESVSRRIFGNLTEKDVSSYENIEKAFNKNISDVMKGGPLQEFVKMNQNRLEENARFIVSFLKVNKAIETISNKKPGAINELAAIIQMGNMEQWRSDLLNNVNGKFDISKLSFGVTTNALTAGFKDSNSYTKIVDNNVGASKSTDVDGNGTAGGTEAKFGLAGFYVGMRISNWQTKYHVNENQLVNSRRKVSEGMNIEDISMKNPEQYAKYLSALFNKEGSMGLDISVINGKIAIINHTNPKVELPKLLNIRVTDAAKNEIIYNASNDSLVIGNVGDISASTIARADGVERRLCLGSKKYAEGKIINLFNTEKNTINNYKMKESGKYQATTMEDLTNLVSEKKNTAGEIIPSPFAKNPDAQTKFMNCFENGQLKKTLPEGITLQGKETKIGAGKLVVFKQDGDKYVLSIENNTDASKLSLRFIDKDNYVNGEKLTFTKIDGSNVDNIEFSIKSLKIKEDFKNLDTKTYGLLDVANKKNTTTFRNFMNAQSFEGAKKALLELLPANDPKLANIITGLKDNNDKTTQHYIIDQFKGVFAYELIYENRSMNTFWEKRSPIDKKTGLPTYPFLKALNIGDKKLNAEILKIRSDMLLNNTEKYTSTKREKVPNLIGFTAFYKDGVIAQSSLVSAGDTKVMRIKNQEYPYTPITENTQSAKDWLVTKINTHPEQKDLLLDSIKSYIKDVTLYPELTGDKFSELIQKGDVTLDKSLKKVILKSRPVVYFKAECVNESVGLIIDGIEIQETPVQDVNVSKEYVANSGSMYNVAATPITDEKTLNGKYHQSAEFGDGSYTKIKDNDKGGDKKDDVDGTLENLNK